jgi:hypothetical protein
MNGHPKANEYGLICDFVGHSWGDAGGLLQICVECEAERWADEEHCTGKPDCRCKSCVAYDESSPL